jgi:hypothetical protein
MWAETEAAGKQWQEQEAEPGAAMTEEEKKDD